MTIHEPAREVPVIAEADVCVIGGSCTGVFAAIRAARLGAKVILIEKAGCFGGVATISLVNVWHSPLDTHYERPIIGGLTVEVMNRLQKRGCVTTREKSPAWAWSFPPAELMVELDEIVREHGITPMLHTAFVAGHVENGKLTAVIVENKSGRQAIRARVFIDATGDADVCHRLGLQTYMTPSRQPSTTCAILDGWRRLEGHDFSKIILEERAEYDLPEGFAWGAFLPGSDAYMLAGTRVYDDCSDGEGLTRAEMEGRRQVRAIMDILRERVPQSKLALLALPSRIGIRDTRHVRCAYQLTGDDVLYGKRFDDAIANGSYRVDVHHHDKPGLTFRYLDGTESYVRPGYPSVEGRWREKTQEDPTFYQIPFRSLLPQGPYDNLLIAGRMADADPQAHAAIRVMVNMNQTGEAAGVAATMALRNNDNVQSVNAADLRTTLADGGSIII